MMVSDSDAALRLHATCVGWDEGAVLLIGDSGCGKSDLALRLIKEGAFLVADDQVELRREDEVLLASPPDSLAGLLEVRGLGILEVGHQEPARLVAAIELVAAEERMPEAAEIDFLGVALPLFRLSPWPVSAAAKVRLAVELATGSIMPAS